MIVIVIVGVLSAIALPNFIGTKDKAEAGATIGSMTGLAKECSLNAIQENSQAIPGVITAPEKTADTTIVDGILLTSLTNANPQAADAAATTNCQHGGVLSNIKAFTAGKVTGMKCGSEETTTSNVATTDSTTCTLTIKKDGSLTGEFTPQ